MCGQISLLEFLLLVKAGASEEMAMPSSFLPLCGLCPFLPARALLILPSFLPPPLLPDLEPTQVSPLPRSAAAHGFQFSLLHSQQPEVRLNHSRISAFECVLPPSEKERNSRGHLTFPLDPHWGWPLRLHRVAYWKILQEMRGWAMGTSIDPQGIDILN